MDKIIERSKWQKYRPFAGVAGVAGIIVSALVISAGGGDTLRIDNRRIGISTVEKGEFQEFIALSGAVVPIKTYFLDAIEGGRVEARYIEAGTFVEKGDKIISLANTNLLLDIMYREAELFQQSNNLRNTKLAMQQNRLNIQSQLLDLDYQILQSKRVFNRNVKLADKSMISSEEYESSRDDYQFLIKKRSLTLQSFEQDSIYREVQVEQLESGLQRMQDNMEIVKQNLENLVITAPVSGQLTSLNAEIGEAKVRGERLGQIDILDGFKVSTPVDEHFITRVQLNQSAHFSIGPNEYTITLNKIYPEVVNGQFRIELGFDNAEPEDIRRGQTLHMRLELGNSEQAILLRRGGFYQETGGQWVYVLDEGGESASKREVKLGRQNQDYYEVLEGLEPGDRVITSSYRQFGDYEQLFFKNES
ncbi:MAG: HlyD family efflux transporter periplasmic adaptor subunit [Candidatus Marinimicrobia bacterium]|jgi:HlyD family secretion protein|nr:HlyD family efflux transporter periplasmic adaptor subunit [Candidatus Neomarinimicrobiota bacterium]MBT3630813.1 HlyD family efflux transporter periplasmic adaptor subunit [Candidatus Neomarinimicrobiota bacterium]MBT3823475.1 HlyD family efflux transporter periplasmic adaptor subunit [Candidatus Neomarinimicrobiota bacterium]MBT4130441.1 HlyD family efflux transporter periplasmic adaptor subunit [Candidatus Neomarinimicrobiota bacterium]MBT4294250.1 HlyD family efflux transporter periplasm